MLLLDRDQNISEDKAVQFSEACLYNPDCFKNQRYSPYLHSMQKRCFDLIICMFLLIPVLILLVVLGLMVLIFDGFPALFFQKRVGKYGVIFTMPKIRTLKKQAVPNIPSCSQNIERLMFPLSKALRRYRLDELPQIFSIIGGKMSFVGPRPEILNVVKQYDLKARKRLYAKPGLTGLWQVRAARTEPIHHNMKYDLYYLRNASLWLDLTIIKNTLLYLVKS